MRPEIARAREFRRTMSEPEVALWSRLKLLRAQGFRFRRQAPYRGYFLDFLCHDRGIVVEVDGWQHGEDRQSEHDFIRDRVLARHGFKVLRFWASDVRYDLDDVMRRIVRELEEAPSVRGSRPGAPRLNDASPP